MGNASKGGGGAPSVHPSFLYPAAGSERGGGQLQADAASRPLQFPLSASAAFPPQPPHAQSHHGGNSVWQPWPASGLTVSTHLTTPTPHSGGGSADALYALQAFTAQNGAVGPARSAASAPGGSRAVGGATTTAAASSSSLVLESSASSGPGPSVLSSSPPSSAASAGVAAAHRALMGGDFYGAFLHALVVSHLPPHAAPTELRALADSLKAAARERLADQQRSASGDYITPFPLAPLVPGLRAQVGAGLPHAAAAVYAELDGLRGPSPSPPALLSRGGSLGGYSSASSASGPSSAVASVVQLGRLSSALAAAPSATLRSSSGYGALPVAFGSPLLLQQPNAAPPAAVGLPGSPSPLIPSSAASAVLHPGLLLLGERTAAGSPATSCKWCGRVWALDGLTNPRSRSARNKQLKAKRDHQPYCSLNPARKGNLDRRRTKKKQRAQAKGHREQQRREQQQQQRAGAEALTPTSAAVAAGDPTAVGARSPGDEAADGSGGDSDDGDEDDAAAENDVTGADAAEGGGSAADA